MFDDLAKKNNKVEDIFSGTEEAVKPDALRPVAPPVVPSAVVSPPSPGRIEEEPGGGGEKVKKILIFAILIIVVVLVVFGIFWVLKKIDSAVNKEATKPPGEQVELDEGRALMGPQEPEIPQDIQTQDIQIIGESPSPTESMFFPPSIVGPVDSDQDGLSDEEEGTFRTDINNTDTDSDGLFDREEVKVYKTDPLNPDTDGDGYLDGDEVKNGYNPLGEGKLYKIE